MASVQYDLLLLNEVEECPVCNILPFHSLSGDKILRSLWETVTTAPTVLRLEELDVAQVRRFAPICDLCKLMFDLYNHWCSHARDEVMEDDGVRYRRPCLRNRWKRKHPLALACWGYSYIATEFDSVPSNRIDSWHAGEHPQSEHAIHLIQRWMGKCEREHQACVNHPSTLPTRVIDLSETNLKLIDPSPDGLHQYTALSHCWGSCPSFLTTRDNLKSRRQGFTLEDLPASFRDAVHVTRGLGIRYLWIDSICVLQGDKDDWETEGAKMADVFANATLTLAAANACDDTEGFLNPRSWQPPTLPVDIRFHSPKEDLDRITRVYVRSAIPPPYSREPLSTRAWCLQEQSLSPRIVYFGHEALRWECLAGCSVEMDTTRSPPNSYTLSEFMPTLLENGKIEYEPWYKMVEVYSSRDITYAGDRLPAISAFASRISERFGDEYLAGVWKRDILRGLLWRGGFKRLMSSAFNENVSLDHAREYLAPTWSWVSYPGFVDFDVVRWSFYRGFQLPTVSLSSAFISVPGRNPFGQVESGSICLHTPLLSFEDRTCVDAPDAHVYISMDYPERHSDILLFGVPILYQDYSPESRQYVMETQKGAGLSEPKRLVIVCGILLKPKMEENHQVVFERVGCFRIYPLERHHFLDVILKNLESQLVELI